MDSCYAMTSAARCSRNHGMKRPLGQSRGLATGNRAAYSYFKPSHRRTMIVAATSETLVRQ